MDLDDVSNHLHAFERILTDPTSKPTLATHMVVFMVRGLFSSLRFPYAQFPCSTLYAWYESAFPSGNHWVESSGAHCRWCILQPQFFQSTFLCRRGNHHHQSHRHSPPLIVPELPRSCFCKDDELLQFSSALIVSRNRLHIATRHQSIGWNYCMQPQARRNSTSLQCFQLSPSIFVFHQFRDY